MKTIQPFIDLGWYTIPLQGELKRLPNGQKTVPIFGKNWLERALQDRNHTATPIGGVITGKESGIIAIDCDNTITYNMFKALDPEYDFHFVSTGKKDQNGNDQESGTIIYRYVDQLVDSFKTTSNSLKLDFLSNGRMTYLPTEENTTKETLTAIPEIKEPPPEVVALLLSIQDAKKAPVNIVSKVSQHKFNLAPQLEMFIKSGEVTRALFKILTPYDFRDCDEYRQHGFVHPKDIEEGRGSEYLSKVSAILGADTSIDVDLYVKAIREINEQFEEPMAMSRLNRTIIEPMCEGRATGEDGEPIWQEDPNWQKNVMSFLTRHGTVISVFYDYQRRLYYVVDIAEERVQTFNQPQQISHHLNSITYESFKPGEITRVVPNVLASSEPERLFGFFTDGQKERFNTFVSTTPYKVFKNPEEYEHHYKRPTITLKFLESLIPDEKMRNYLLSFIRRKLDTFDYSPVILYFLGVPGSGKDTFVNLIERILGEAAIARPSTKIFLEKNNSWMLDSLFVQLDEYGDQLTSFNDKQEALGLLKQYTGKPRLSIRVMREDVYSYDHKVTFIMTANKNPLMLDADDRRIALFSTPNRMLDENWVHDLGGIDIVHQQLIAETNDFCYYLATSIQNIEAKSYTTPLVSDNKAKLIAESMPIAKRLAFYLKTKNWKEFKNIGDRYGPRSLYDTVDKNKILEQDLVELYEELKGTELDPRANATVRHAMKDLGLEPTRTTLPGNRHGYAYYIPGLKDIVNYVSEIEDE
jgi:hypothetical protein